MTNFQQRQLVAWQTRMICSWLVKLTPDMESDQANKLLKEATAISLDGMLPEGEPEEEKSARGPVVNPGLATRKDFYNMSDEEIERNLSQSDNGNGSFEALLRGFGKS
jgi:hypothetical protein